MKHLVLTIIFIFALATQALAGGDVYFGRFFDSRMSGGPSGANPNYVAGVKLDEPMLHDYLTPYLGLETLMDAQNSDGSFHPISIRYTVGVNVKVYDRFYVAGERMCWHPVDHGAYVDQYWLVKGGYRW
jgi:hypothetical protein